MSHEQVGPSSNDILEEVNLPEGWGLQKTKGKVRDVYDLNDGRLLIIATDRLSAFDRQVGLLANRGQILNELSEWWFNQTSDIVPNHMIGVPHPNVMLVKKCQRINLEVIARGFNTGSTSTSIWKRYEQGQRKFGDIDLPDGMKKDDRLLLPIVELTSKADKGRHDENLTKDEIIKSGIVTAEECEQLQVITLRLFNRGQVLARRSGLTLVDTKYEFGRDPVTGKIVIIDEIHTPDSSRYWREWTTKSYDKEYIRLWLSGQGYTGDSVPPVIPQEVMIEAKRRYVFVYESLMERVFQPQTGDIGENITKQIGLLLNKTL